MNEPVGVLGRISYSDINKNGLVEANEILSEADYYPFGLKHTENSVATTANKAAEKYQYNAKEFQDELNLNVFDYGARNYAAAIGRWFNHDPLSEMTLDPYGYTYNNPINLIDPNGMFETKFGAWWHKLWNGSSDAGGIEYNDQRSEYYYNDMVASSSDEISFKTIYNSVEGDAGKPVFEIEGSASVGVQVGVKTGWGRIEGDVMTGEIGKVGWSNQEKDNRGFYSDWGDGKGHNFASIGVGLLSNKLGVGLGVDYITSNITPPGGDILSYYSNNGEAVGGFNLGPNPRYFWKPKANTLLSDLGGGVRLRGRANTQNNHVIDLSFGVKAILGVEGKIKVGFTSRR